VSTDVDLDFGVFLFDLIDKLLHGFLRLPCYQKVVHVERYDGSAGVEGIREDARFRRVRDIALDK
jgi:hypothetical protein